MNVWSVWSVCDHQAGGPFIALCDRVCVQRPLMQWCQNTHWLKKVWLRYLLAVIGVAFLRVMRRCCDACLAHVLFGVVGGAMCTVLHALAWLALGLAAMPCDPTMAGTSVLCVW